MRSQARIVGWFLCVTGVAAQSQGPFDGQPGGRPVSAQQSQLSGADPTGRGAVLVRACLPFCVIQAPHLNTPQDFEPDLLQAETQ